MIPCLTICMSRNDNQFVMINYANNSEFGCGEAYGPVVRLSYQDMEREGLNHVLQSLREYFKRTKIEKSELELLTKKEKQVFDKGHKHVTVSLQKGDELWLGPMHFNKRGGMESGGAKERVIIRLPTTQDGFFKALQEAFRVAS